MRLSATYLGAMWSERKGLCRLALGAQLVGISAGGAALHERLACLVCSRVLGCLAAVISRAKLLAPKEQVAFKNPSWTCTQSAPCPILAASCELLILAVIAWVLRIDTAHDSFNCVLRSMWRVRCPALQCTLPRGLSGSRRLMLRQPLSPLPCQ